MTRLREIGLFVGPSPFSVIFVIISTLFLVLVGNLSFLTQSGLLANTFLGSDSLPGLVETSSLTWSEASNTILSNGILNKLLFFVFWMVIGLVVFVVLNGIGHFLSEAEHDLASLSYVHSIKSLVEKHLVFRILLRSAALVGLVLTLWALWQFIFPYAVLASRIWANSPRLHINWFYMALGMAALMLTLHALVVWLRLLVLRPRVFGAWDRFVD